MDTLRGGCHCGAIRFEITGKAGPMAHCHCSRCRKTTGAAYQTWMLVRRKYFRWVAGEDLVQGWVPPPPATTVRSFCPRCGCTLGDLRAGRDPMLSAAILDDDPGRRPLGHEFVGSKAPWFEIGDDLPQHAEEFPGEEGS